MKFIRYNSIDNLTNKAIEKLKTSKIYDPKDIWVVTEKVDGSNFAIYIDGDGVMKPAKRSTFIDKEKSSFFNFQDVFKKYEKGFKNIAFALMNSRTKPSHVSIHGELCGGFYEGLEKESRVKAVQKRVQYTNETEFIVFDIKLYFEDGTAMYLPYDEVVKVCNQYKVPVLPIIYQGVFDDAYVWAVNHNEDVSKVWKIFNVEIEATNNIREGNVIKPLNCDLFNGLSRIIYKTKNDKFNEKEDKGKKNKKVAVLDMESEELIKQADNYITMNRFHSVVSKFGEYTIRDFGALLHLMTDDIIDEMIRDELADEISDAVRKRINKLVSIFFVKNKMELF